MRCSSDRETVCGLNLIPPLPPRRDLHEGALPGHHRAERLEIVERNALVVANPPLERAEDIGMLNAVPFEEPDFAVVHTDGEMHDDLVLGLAQNQPDVLGEIDDPGGAVEVVLHHFEELVLGRARLTRRGEARGSHETADGDVRLTHPVGISLDLIGLELPPESIQVDHGARHEEGIQAIEHCRRDQARSRPSLSPPPLA